MAPSPPPSPPQGPKGETAPSPTSKKSSAILSTNATAFSNPAISYTCAEQSYMFCKALYFSDADTARLVLSTPDPKEQKKHGQKAKDFDFTQWGTVKSRVARVGNWYKYTEGIAGGSSNGKGVGNRHMRSVLLGTQGRELAEAGRRDKIWGIGYKSDEAELYREFWGENLLGRCLMDVRDRIIELNKKMAEGILEESVDWEWDGQLSEEPAVYTTAAC